MTTEFVKNYLAETLQIVAVIDASAIESVVQNLRKVRDGGGRLFVLGVGGSAAHASHAVNDFRKLCALETYCPTDNSAELTARINDGGDRGWELAYSEWLAGSRLSAKDAVLIISVGGGNLERKISLGLIRCMELAKSKGAKILGVVGRDGGETAKMAGACVIIPPLYNDRVTPHTEGLASVVLHLLVSHPDLQATKTTW